MLFKGAAYRCYASQADLEAMRETARLEGKPMRYDGRWRDRDPSEAPAGVAPVIRLRAPQRGGCRTPRAATTRRKGARFSHWRR